MPLLLVAVVVLALLLVAVVMFAVVVVVVSVCAVCSLGFVRIIGVNYGQVRQPVAAFMPRLLLRHHPSSCSPRRNPTGSAAPLCQSVPKKWKAKKKEKS